jgi:predicted ferric reductase
MKTTLRQTKVRLVIFFLITTLISSVLWFLSRGYYISDFRFEDLFKYLGGISGYVAIVFMSFNFILAARYQIVENLLTSLDKLFRIHKWTGILGFSFAMNHVLFLALDNITNFFSYYIPVLDNVAYKNIGMLALYSLFIIITLARANFLPYHIWKFIHSFMGVPFIIAGVHIYLVSSAFGFLPAQLWLGFWLAVGVISYIYAVFLFEIIGPGFTSKVYKIERLGDITGVYIKKPIEFKYIAGQFAFIKFLDGNFSQEPHPYTISSAPQDGYLRFSIKGLGDWSKSLSGIKEGVKIKVIGPYGHFNAERLHSAKKQVWIAGGIGVTPFLSMAKSEGVLKTCEDITFIYSCKSKGEAVFEEEIMSFEAIGKNIKFVPHYSDASGYLTADYILNLGDNVSDSVFLFCGPKPMTRGLIKQLSEKGVPYENFAFEYFDFRE